MFTNLYDIEYSDYWLANNERLEDRASNNKLARDKVYLIFLLWKSYRALKKESIVILEAFAALYTYVYLRLQKYNELEYRIDTSKLQMFC